MRSYEAIYIVRPSVTKDDLNGVVDKMNKIITQNGGEIKKIDHWGMRKLAYSIKKEYQGYYVYTVFLAESGTVHELERNMRIDDNIIKYLTIKLKDLQEVLEEKKSKDPVEEPTEEELEEAV